MSSQKQRPAAVKFIFATIFLDSLGIGLLIPVMPDVIRRFGTDPAFVSHYFGFFISIYALMQFVASPVLGGLSDRYGRRPILLVSLLGAGLDYVLMAFAPTLPLLFLGRIVSGLTGASMTVASSYMADISNDENRSANFGMIGAAFGLGFIVGPGIGGLLGNSGYKAPFLAAAVLNLVNFFFGLFVLPESLPATSRRRLETRRLNPLRSLTQLLRAESIGVLVCVFGLISLAGNVHPSVWTLYTQHKFAWTSFQVGLSLSTVGLCIAIAQGGLTRVIIPKIGEHKSLALGLWVYVIGFVLFAIATQGWMMYAILVFFALSGIAGPAIQSLISGGVPPSEQGELQGGLISIASLMAILAPLLYTNLFAHFTSDAVPTKFAGAPYLMAAVISLVGYLLVRLAWRGASKKSL